MDETWFKEEAGWPPVRVLMPEDPVMGGLDGVDNAAPKALTQRTNQLRQDLETTNNDVSNLKERVETLAAADGPALEEALRASLLDLAPYRFFEMFAPGWSLIDTPALQPLEVVILTTPVAGDDSIDVSDTASLHVGGCYVLFDGAVRQEIEIVEILNRQRIRIAPSLTIALSPKARLGRCDWVIAPRAATAPKTASSYYSRTVDLGPSPVQRAVLVRSAPTKAGLRCAFRMPPGGVWSECVWSWKREGPGWQEIEFLLPASGIVQIKVMVEAADEPTLIRRVVILEAASGLGGVGNGPEQPRAMAPQPGESGIGAVVSFCLSPYASPTNAAQMGMEIELRCGALTVLASGLLKGALSSYSTAAGLLLPASRYAWRGRYRDHRDIPSPWSLWAEFSTLSSFVGVAAPSPLSPAHGAASVACRPILTASPMVVTGGSDTHAASQWQVIGEKGDFASPLYDSGESGDLVSHTVTAKLEPLKRYGWRVRMKAAKLGWSPWSGVSSFETAAQPNAPSNLSPKPGQEYVALTGPLTLAKSEAGEVVACQWQIAADESFKTIIHDSGECTQLLSYTIPEGTLKNLTRYRFRARHKDAKTGYGDWSVATFFETRLATGSVTHANYDKVTRVISWTRPKGVNKWRVTVIGAGGCGGAAYSRDPQRRNGGRGGVGGISTREYTVDDGDLFPLIAGQSNNTGRPGGTSSFGASQYATGGTAGGSNISGGADGAPGVGYGGNCPPETDNVGMGEGAYYDPDRDVEPHAGYVGLVRIWWE